MSFYKIFLLFALTLFVTKAYSEAVIDCLYIGTSSVGNLSCRNSSASDTDWEVDCGAFRVEGTWLCSNLSGGDVGSTKTDTEMTSNSSNLSSNKVCWCKSYYPGASKWTYAETFSDYRTCMLGCVVTCNSMLGSSAPFRTGMLNSLGG